MIRHDGRSARSARGAGIRVGDADVRLLERRLECCAVLAVQLADFVRDATRILLDFTGCDSLGLWLRQPGRLICYELAERPERTLRFLATEGVHWFRRNEEGWLGVSDDYLRLCDAILAGHSDTTSPHFTPQGSFWTGNAWESVSLFLGPEDTGRLQVGGIFKSLAVIPFRVSSDGSDGLLHLRHVAGERFRRRHVEFFESLGAVIGRCIAGRDINSAARSSVASGSVAPTLPDPATWTASRVLRH